VSLSPALMHAEKSRKDEEGLREQFTRCRVDKSDRRNSSYMYIDIDADLHVSPDEYEKRYYRILEFFYYVYFHYLFPWYSVDI
jgi:hypothetical protein